jgi:hypothetical protein
VLAGGVCEDTELEKCGLRIRLCCMPFAALCRLCRPHAACAAHIRLYCIPPAYARGRDLLAGGVGPSRLRRAARVARNGAHVHHLPPPPPFHVWARRRRRCRAAAAADRRAQEATPWADMRAAN